MLTYECLPDTIDPPGDKSNRRNHDHGQKNLFRLRPFGVDMPNKPVSEGILG